MIPVGRNVQDRVIIGGEVLPEVGEFEDAPFRLDDCLRLHDVLLEHHLEGGAAPPLPLQDVAPFLLGFATNFYRPHFNIPVMATRKLDGVAQLGADLACTLIFV